MRINAVLGPIVLVGLLGQLLLGFAVRGSSFLSNIHAIVGFAGFAVVLVFGWIVIRSGVATTLSKVLLGLLILTVGAQTYLGLVLFMGNDLLRMSHQFTGITTVVLGVGMGIVTGRSIRRGR